MKLKNFLLLLALMTVLSCSKDDDSTPAVKTHIGSWNLTSISLEDATGTDDGDPVTRVDFSYDEEDVVLIIKDDGAYTSTGDFDWEVELITIISGGSSSSGTGDYDFDFFGDGSWTRSSSNLNLSKGVSNPFVIVSESDTELKLSAVWKENRNAFGKLIWEGKLVFTFTK